MKMKSIGNNKIDCANKPMSNGYLGSSGSSDGVTHNGKRCSGASVRRLNLCSNKKYLKLYFNKTRS